MEACYAIGVNFCYPTLKRSDDELAKLSRMIVTFVDYLFRHKEGNKILCLNDRDLLPDLDKAEYNWTKKLDSLVSKGLLQTNSTNWNLDRPFGRRHTFSIPPTYKRVGNVPNAKDIEIAINNVNMMMEIMKITLSS